MIENLYQKFKSCTSVSTDTRMLDTNSMFFALKGPNFNGNTYVEDAFKNGAKYCVVDDTSAVINAQCILVKDTLKTLQELAAYHRKRINIKIIGLTGSNGKTTTKTLIYSVLKTKYKVKATKGNLNNHIGVPLTLLSFSEDLDFGIVEMGANHQKEIAFLCHMVQPNYGLITNFGKAHLEGFGGFKGVIKGKSELYDYLIAHHKTVFINTNNDLQLKQIGKYSKTITFGSKTNNDCVITYKKADPFVSIYYEGILINSQLIGPYNYDNIAIAIAIGNHFNITTKGIKKAIEGLKPNNNRSEIIEKKSLKIILDAYNANPTSMLVALKNFKQLKTENKYLFLGDMFELGEAAEKEHQAIANFTMANFKANVFLIGKNFYNSEVNDSIKKYPSFDAIKPLLKNLKLENSSILIKGSRSMALERILEFL